jgi:hypothetical protein
MGIISGQDAELQIGKETAWGTGVAPTVVVDFTDESLEFIPTYLEEDALLGRKFAGRMDVDGKQVGGGFGMIVKPDNIGLLLFAALGVEADAAAANVGSTVYDHAFTAVAGGLSGSLPKLTIVVDRKVAVFGYVSCKVDSMSMEAAVSDYLRATFEVRGHSEQDDALEALSASTLIPFRFSGGTVSVDSSVWADVQRASLTYNNNLETDLFTMDGSIYMQEIEPQKRECTVDIDVLYSSTTNTARSDKFLTGSTIAIELEFDTGEVIADALNYKLTIAIPLAYITTASPNIGGPERITQTLSCKATEDSSNEAVTVTLRDGQGTKHSA